MFGFPAAFVNGNMFMGLHQDNMVLRLPDGGRSELLKIEGARTFEPMPGRPMREYIVVPPSVMENRKALTDWVKRAFDYGVTLPPKTATKRQPTLKTAATKTRSKPLRSR
jgi:hypothetical protein